MSHRVKKKIKDKKKKKITAGPTTAGGAPAQASPQVDQLKPPY